MKPANLKPAFVSIILLLISLTTYAQMDEAYKLANEMVREKLYREDHTNIKVLDGLTDNDIIVIRGTYDHIGQVLHSLKIPYAEIDQEDLLSAKLKPHQTVFVNCASSFSADMARKLATFVEAGGQLITTDWALLNVIEVAFPNTIAFNQQPTADEVVRVEVVDKQDSVVLGFLDEKAAPVWWLEGSSYPIKVLNPEKVKVLIKSKELKEKYGEEAVVVRFSHGKGTVYHMLSHLYLQRTETREGKQDLAATEYFKDKGASSETISKAAGSGVTYGEVQSANTTSDFVSRLIINQKKKAETPKSDK
jgi:hypothetical protein